jgi:hypothetical protein
MVHFRALDTGLLPIYPLSTEFVRVSRSMSGRILKVSDHMRRVAAWLILISYSLIACGNVLESGCCHDESAHFAGKHAAHKHLLSKVPVMAHILSHSTAPEHTQFLTRHCCCVKNGDQDPGLPPHVFAGQSSTPANSDFPSRSVPSGWAHVLEAPSIGSSHLLTDLSNRSLLQSIRATVLLI